MPTQKPRVAVTLDPETAAALHDLADAMKRPAATIAAEFLTEFRSSMVALAQIVRHTQAGNKAAAKRALQHMVGAEMVRFLEQSEAKQPDLFNRRKRSKAAG